MEWDEVLQQYDVVHKDVILNSDTTFSLAQIRDINALVDQMGPEDFGDDERLPYWASLWPVARQLASYVLRSPEQIQAPVLELGCGLGLISLTIAHLGHKILATDYEPEAVAFTTHNAKLNELEVTARRWDWRELSLMTQRYQTVVGADLLYEVRNVAPVVAALVHLLKPGGTALIVDPNRPHWRQFQDMLVTFGLQVSIVEGEEHVIVVAKKTIES